jgi:hypothetical protein
MDTQMEVDAVIEVGEELSDTDQPRKRRRTYVRREKLPKNPKVAGSWEWMCPKCHKGYKNWAHHAAYKCPIEQWMVLRDQIEEDLLKEAEAEAQALKSKNSKYTYIDEHGIRWEQV